MRKLICTCASLFLLSLGGMLSGMRWSEYYDPLLLMALGISGLAYLLQLRRAEIALLLRQLAGAPASHEQLNHSLRLLRSGGTFVWQTGMLLLLLQSILTSHDEKQLGSWMVLLLVGLLYLLGLRWLFSLPAEHQLARRLCEPG